MGLGNSVLYCDMDDLFPFTTGTMVAGIGTVGFAVDVFLELGVECVTGCGIDLIWATSLG